MLHFEGRYDEAIALSTRILQTDPTVNTSRMDLSLSLMATGELDRALTELDTVASKLGRLSSVVMLRGWCDAKAGRVERARAAYAELDAQSREGKASGDELALLAIMVGEPERAPAFLETGCQRKAPLLAFASVEPIFRPVVEHPLCRLILDRYGLLADKG